MRTGIFELMFLVSALEGQTRIDLRTQSKNVDFSGATSSTPWVVGSTLPATCVVGQAFFNTSAAVGANVFVCTAPNQWTVTGGNGNSPVVTFASGNGPPLIGCIAGQNLYVDLMNQDSWFCESSNVWKKSLTTNNLGPFSLNGQNGSALGAASSGTTSLFFSATAKLAQTVDDTGNTATMIRPTDCSVGNQPIQKINADGTATCASGPAFIAGTRPACTAALRGAFSETFGVIGQADTLSVCLKDVANVFAWRTLF